MLNLYVNMYNIDVLIVLILYECSILVIGGLQNWNHGWSDVFK